MNDFKVLFISNTVPQKRCISLSVEYVENQTLFIAIRYGAPQGIVLGPILLIYKLSHIKVSTEIFRLD